MKTPTLHELNAHLFASTLGNAVTLTEAPEPGKRAKSKKAAADAATEPRATQESGWTDAQRTALSGVGVNADQLATMSDAEVESILETLSKAK
jgi:hypothetical protein